MLSEVAKALAESEQQFVKQFDRDSLMFHNGDPTPVPVGGYRVPNSMPTEYPVDFDPSINNENVVTSPEIEEQIVFRDFFDEMKKVLSKVCVPIEAIFRHNEKYNAAPTEKNRQTTNALVDEDKKKLEGTLTELQQFQKHLETTKYKEKYVESLQKVIDTARGDFPTKEAVTDFGFVCKRLMEKCFAEKKAILEHIKVLKRGGKPLAGKKGGEPPKPQAEATKGEENKVAAGKGPEEEEKTHT